MVISVAGQSDHVLTSWMCVGYEKTDRGLHRHIYHRMEGHAPGECSNMKTNWTCQTSNVATGRRLYALHMDNKVTLFKSP